MFDKVFSNRVAVMVVVANMIGTGVFTSLGFQVQSITSGFALLMLWLVGGITAFCGALCYAELAARYPKSGGEYAFLTEAIHPAAGFVSGWISSTVGFAAPVALACMTFAAYLSPWFPEWDRRLLAFVLLIVMTLLHSLSRNSSGNTQFLLTTIKLLVILGFVATAVPSADMVQDVVFYPRINDIDILLSASFAVSLVYVNYAYNGWNAAVYFSGEIEDPKRNLPRILLLGTTIVTICYLALNAVFLLVAPMESLAGVVEIGYVVATFAYGDSISLFVSGVLALLLTSTVSAMTLAGPRVLKAIGRDFKVLSWLAATRDSGLPVNAIVFQTTIAAALIATDSFADVLVFSGFLLALNNWFTVLAVWVARRRDPHRTADLPFTVWAYPLPMILFLAVFGGTLWFLAVEKPLQVVWSILVLGAGLMLYKLFIALERQKPS